MVFDLGISCEFVMFVFNLVMVSFVSMMFIVCSFVVKNGYDIDVDKEFWVFGVVNVVVVFL